MKISSSANPWLQPQRVLMLGLQLLLIAAIVLPAFLLQRAAAAQHIHAPNSAVQLTSRRTVARPRAKAPSVPHRASAAPRLTSSLATVPPLLPKVLRSAPLYVTVGRTRVRVPPATRSCLAQVCTYRLAAQPTVAASASSVLTFASPGLKGMSAQVVPAHAGQTPRVSVRGTTLKLHRLRPGRYRVVVLAINHRLWQFQVVVS